MPNEHPPGSNVQEPDIGLPRCPRWTKVNISISELRNNPTFYHDVPDLNAIEDRLRVEHLSRSVCTR